MHMVRKQIKKNMTPSNSVAMKYPIGFIASNGNLEQFTNHKIKRVFIESGRLNDLWPYHSEAVS